MPEFWLSTTDGLHVPVMPFVDVAGKTGAVAPLQIVCDVPKLNVGVRIAFTVTVNVTLLIHCSGVASGVNT